MHVEIITPGKSLYKGEASLVQVPGSDGSFEILKNHAPIISTLDKGTVKIREEEGTVRLFEIEGGIIEAKANHIIVLAEIA
jgi:F-type H+-transporting ATPase subunit epsilon